jgi:multidrug efflux system membrane fusion protein
MFLSSSATRPLAALAFGAIAAAVLSACAPARSNDGQAAPPPVTVQTPQQAFLPENYEHVGRVEAIQQVDVRPRVSGQIIEIAFAEGAAVGKGDVLARLDPRPYQAVVERARAAVVKARAEAELATLEAERAAKLEGVAAMSKEEAQRRRANAAVAAAQVQTAEAGLASAQLDLEFTTIRAPIAGRVGRADVSAGNLVTPDPSARPITTLVSNGAVYVAFDVNDTLAARVLQARADARARPTVRLATAAGAALDVPVELAFADNRMGTGTGTMRLRARAAAVPQLAPGAFVRVTLGFDTREPALLIDDRAIGIDQDKRFVLVVDAAGQVVHRAVDLGARNGEQRVIKRGLSAGERVIVDGLAFARPGMKVSPQDAPAQASQAPKKLAATE